VGGGLLMLTMIMMGGGGGGGLLGMHTGICSLMVAGSGHLRWW
jgi:hypothetical protein